MELALPPPDTVLVVTTPPALAPLEHGAAPVRLCVLVPPAPPASRLAGCLYTLVPALAPVKLGPPPPHRVLVLLAPPQG